MPHLLACLRFTSIADFRWLATPWHLVHISAWNDCTRSHNFDNIIVILEHPKLPCSWFILQLPVAVVARASTDFVWLDVTLPNYRTAWKRLAVSSLVVLWESPEWHGLVKCNNLGLLRSRLVRLDLQQHDFMSRVLKKDLWNTGKILHILTQSNYISST